MAQAIAISPSILPFLLPSWSSRNSTLKIQKIFPFYSDSAKNLDKNGRKY
jgi:hypothetical protein